MKSECFLHPQFTKQTTFYPHPTSDKYGFKNPRRCRWEGCNKQSSWGGVFLHKLLLQLEFKMNQILPPPQNPDTYPSNPELKAGLRGNRMEGIKNHPSPLLDYPTTLLLILPKPSSDRILLGSLPLLRIL